MRIIKNLLISVLSILLLMSIVSACNDKKEEVGFDSNGFKYELNETETGYIVSRGDFKGDEIIIPAEYNGLPVTEIKTFSYFNYETPILKVEIPNTVTKIWDYAFADCPIISISIPSSVVSMGYSAFNGCSYLTDITIPFVGAKMGETEASEKTLFGYIFGTKQYDTGVEITQNYSANETITYIIPSSLKMVTVLSGDILYGAFSNCFMRELNVGDGVINIESYAFDGCYSLTSVSIGNSVKEIPASLFYNCNLLTSVTIGNSVESIGSSAFSGCSSLASVNYTEDINSWANINFDNAGANPICFAKKLYINEKKVTTAEITIGQISNYAFYNCTSLTYVTIGNGVEIVGDYSFYNCSSLTNLTIGDGVESVGDYSFYNCSSLTNLTIGDGVESVGDYAFYNCSSLTSVTIGYGVTSIGNYAFRGCSSLMSVVFENTSGWVVYTFGTMGIDVTKSDTNATNLKHTYSKNYWKRNA